ncbi:MAG TPA: hypothetical protein ENK05_10260 [Gammaproteobacteria bacterium]|nr:hypothetical protein [Gammaproteobacteria bacterium]
MSGRFVFVLLLTGVLLGGCEGKTGDVGDSFEPQLLEALALTGQDRSTLVLPRVPYPVSTPARMALVDRSLADPPSMASLTRRLLAATGKESRSRYLRRLLAEVDAEPARGAPAPEVSMEQIIERLRELAPGADIGSPPPAWSAARPFASALRALLYQAIDARRSWREAFGEPQMAELQPLTAEIASLLAYRGRKPNGYRLLKDDFHALGARQRRGILEAALLDMLAAAERIPPGGATAGEDMAGEWQTPLGKVEVAGGGDDRHRGGYLLLIDTGGDDRYQDVGAPPDPGSVSVVLDLGGNDEVHWAAVPGPGAGVLGLALWLDREGDDRYAGGSLGLGVGILGAGVFLDAAGNDRYEAAALSEGAAQYGVGILVDDAGDDRYRASFSGQGYGTTGGIGMLVDGGGNDEYDCGGVIADPVKKRAGRHRSTRYLSLCQGFGFGLRPKISGGVGLLLDRDGDDRYKVGIFGQGAGYWFGLGILAEGGGDDRYQGFEHVQGEGLHLAAGVLGDYGGDDQYSGYEHAQGVGKDRAAGLLYERDGDDVYEATRASQGAGLASYGVGILVDRAGDDRYRAQVDSQGFSGRPDPGFPEREWPTGVLLDLGGDDLFEQTYGEALSGFSRIQNRQGVALRYGRR